MVNGTKSGFKRVWLITGASRGLGALIAQAALADGNAVVATGRNAAAVVERLGNSPALLPVALDVTDEAPATAAVEAALEKFGRIDVLVNNAGFGLLGAIEESSNADVRRMYDTNVFGLLNVTRAVLPVMRATGRPRDQYVVARRLSVSRGIRRLLSNEVCSRRFD
jgi:NADP-dependent 3-hydroxy acid dehydrogenase YdfG